MTFAAIPWLSISINLLLVVFVIVCLLMTLLILMQRPKQEGLGAAFGGGVTDQVFGARTTNVLQRGTVYCGTLFFVLALVLAILIGHQNKDSALLTEKKAKTEEAGPESPAPATGDTGTQPTGGDATPSLLDDEDTPDKPEEDKTPEGEVDQPEEDKTPEEPVEKPEEDKAPEGENDKPE